MILTCEWCGESFSSGSTGRSRFCSKVCRGKEYHARTYTLKTGRRIGSVQVCAHCHQEYLTNRGGRKWCYDCSPDQSASSRMVKYKLSNTEFLKKLSDQNGSCALCNEDVPLHIDHDHSCCVSRPTCGKCTRGLLCHRCNIMLGFIEKSKLLPTIEEYLQLHRSHLGLDLEKDA